MRESLRNSDRTSERSLEVVEQERRPLKADVKRLAMKRMIRRRRRRRPEVSGGNKDFWEIYGGVCALTFAVLGIGLSAFDPLDIDIGRWQDVLSKPVQEWILGRIRRRQVRWVHLAPRCRDFSRSRRCGTRTASYPEGDGSDPEELVGNQHADFVREVIICCLSSGVWFSVEHPRASFIWWLPAWIALAALPEVFYVDLDQCAFGARPPDAVMFEGDVRTMKSTRLMSNATPLKRLAQKCRHDHQHVV